jgi:general secretion pathway protein C
MRRAPHPRVNLKRIDVAVRLLVLALFGVLVSRFATTLLEDRIRPPPDAIGSDVVARTTGALSSAVSIAALLERNLFHAAVAATLERPRFLARCAGWTRGKLALVATVVSSDLANAFAVLEDKASGALTIVRPGAPLGDGGEVASIGWREVRIQRDATCEILSFHEETEAPRPESRIRKTSDTEIEIDRPALEGMLEDLPKLGLDGRIVPVVENGHVIGFRLSALRPDGAFTRLGAVEGDVLLRVNGIEVQDFRRLLDLQASIKDLSTIHVDVLRNGEKRTLTYQVR